MVNMSPYLDVDIFGVTSYKRSLLKDRDSGRSVLPSPCPVSRADGSQQVVDWASLTQISQSINCVSFSLKTSLIPTSGWVRRRNDSKSTFRSRRDVHMAKSFLFVKTQVLCFRPSRKLKSYCWLSSAHRVLTTNYQPYAKELWCFECATMWASHCFPPSSFSSLLTASLWVYFSVSFLRFVSLTQLAALASHASHSDTHASSPLWQYHK